MLLVDQTLVSEKHRRSEAGAFLKQDQQVVKCFAEQARQCLQTQGMLLISYAQCLYLIAQVFDG